ncbi:MucBP domain-containing protein, partial [Romboutsia ilealis]|uniref:MucBP domain-containing protein n=1 Tax=Romboutsia ilealis TaxID=1115758 RepID=UPI0026F37E77
PQLVTYVYKKKVVLEEKGKVISKYVDEDGNNLCKDLIYSGKLETDYKTSQLMFPGYKLKEIIGNERGVYQKEEQEVKYVYTKIAPDEMTEEDEKIGGSVLVRYEDDKGNILEEDIIYNGDIGDRYSINKAGIANYEIIEVIGDEQGEIEKDIKVITVVYKPIEKEVKASTVIAKYVDIDGNTIHFDNIYNGFVGEKYKTNSENIKGYELVRVEGKESGVFAEDVKVVTYVYKEVGRVIIRYVDENGNIIREEDTYSGAVGDAFEFNYPNIAGYRYVKVEGNTKGHYTKDDQNLTFIYEKIKDEENKPPLIPNPPKKPNITINGDKKDDIDLDLMGDDVDNNKNVKTSDESNPYLYMLSALLSMLGIIYL